jgi:hypothetical protein
MPTVLAPPERFDHPYRDGPVIEKLLTLEEVRKLCASIGIYADGCSAFINLQDGSRACWIILPSDGFDTVAAYRRHEVGHCNGWAADHSE